LPVPTVLFLRSSFWSVLKTSWIVWLCCWPEHVVKNTYARVLPAMLDFD